jgi:hypothetical protein
MSYRVFTHGGAVCLDDGHGSDNLTPAEARALAAELVKAAHAISPACEYCYGTGIHHVLERGMCTPDYPCKHCRGTGAITQDSAPCPVCSDCLVCGGSHTLPILDPQGITTPKPRKGTK